MDLKPASTVPSRPTGLLRLLALGGILFTTSLPPFTAARAQSVPRALASSPLTASAGAYTLGPGDQVNLVMLDPAVKDLGGTFEILNDGSASLAMLGSVVLEGLTLNQATQWLTRVYGRYLRRPELNLSVVRPRPIQVSLVGEVQSPGLYSLTDSEASQAEPASSTSSTAVTGLPTLVTAIRKAGGLTSNANLSDVVLRRRLPGSTDQLEERRLDLLVLLRQGDKQQNPFLFDGDTVMIGTAEAIDPEDIELAFSNLAPPQIQVNVVGEVVAPGRIPLPANTPLVQAVLAAGGPVTFRGRRSDVELVRINRNGTATREFFQLDYSQGMSGPLNPPLRNGDSVIVNRSAYAKVSDAIGAVANPISGLVNILLLADLINNF